MAENTRVAMEQGPANRRNFLHIISLILGGLAVWPYPIIWIAPLLLKTENPPLIIGTFIGVVTLIIAPCNGVPFGIAGAVTGILAMVKIVPVKQRSLVIVVAVIGVLLSAAGCISNVLYFTQLTPWQSVPQQ